MLYLVMLSVGLALAFLCSAALLVLALDLSAIGLVMAWDWLRDRLDR